VPKEIEAGAALANCRALARVSAEKSLVNVSSAILLYLEFAVSTLNKSAPRQRKRG